MNTEIPPEIIEAAKLIDEWFKAQGVETWELMGVCSRNHVDMLEQAQRNARFLSDMYPSGEGANY